jgi:hypothetical protein
VETFENDEQDSMDECGEELIDKFEDWDEMLAERNKDENERKPEVVSTINDIKVDRTKPNEIVVVLKQNPPDVKEEPNIDEKEIQKQKEEII